MSNNDSFVRLVRQNKIINPLEEIYDYIEKWHNSSNSVPDLYKYLGFTEREYRLWLLYPRKLVEIINGEVI